MTRKAPSWLLGTALASAARTMRHLFVLLLLGLLVACGGTDGGPSSAEAPVLFPASKGGSYFIVAARPETGEVNAFGPALPVDAATMDWFDLHVSADGKRVAAVFTPKPGIASASSVDEVLLVGDGVGWKTIDHAPGVQLVDASDDLSLLAVGHPCLNRSAAEVSLVFDADGKVLYQDAACAPGSARAVLALAPDGSYFVSRSQSGDFGLTIHRTDGQEVTVTGVGSGDAGSSGPILLRAFPTSLLIADAELEPARWVGTDGKSVDVAGWTPAPAARAGAEDVIVIGGVIYGLQDRATKRLADVPPGVDPARVADVRGGFVITSGPANGYQVVNADGAVVATYTSRPPRSVPPGTPSGKPIINGIQLTESRANNDAWNLFLTQYDMMTTADEVTYESADELWLFLDRGGAAVSRTLELRRAPVLPGQSDDAGYGRAYVSSSTGAFVLYSEGGALHAVDVDSSADRVLATDSTIKPVGGSIRRHHAPRW